MQLGLLKILRYFAACLGILCSAFTLIKDGSRIFLFFFFYFFHALFKIAAFLIFFLFKGFFWAFHWVFLCVSFTCGDFFLKDGSLSSSLFPRWPHPFPVRGQLPLATRVWNAVSSPKRAAVLICLQSLQAPPTCLNCIFSSEPAAAPVSSVCTLHPSSTVTSLPNLGCASVPVSCLPLPLLGTQTVSYSGCLPLPLTRLSTLSAE